jgi:hypothetical protein
MVSDEERMRNVEAQIEIGKQERERGEEEARGNK